MLQCYWLLYSSFHSSVLDFNRKTVITVTYFHETSFEIGVALITLLCALPFRSISSVSTFTIQIVRPVEGNFFFCDFD